jgi:glycosyltransferase involved in cell wall biosynthesis
MAGRLLYVVTEGHYFLSHRQRLAEAARAAGWEVAVACQKGTGLEAVEAAGFTVHEVPFRRFGRNPLRELETVASLTRLYRALRPALVHHIALKPVILGGLAARIAGVPAMVQAVAGLGHAFTETGPEWRAFQSLFRALLPFLVPSHARLLLQHEEDRRRLVGEGPLAGRARVIAGSGVDLTQFHPQPEPDAPLTVLMAARLIEKKGLADLVEASRVLRAGSVDIRVCVAGLPDPGHPGAIPEETLRAWQDQGLIEFLGYRRDIAHLMAECHVVCLPSRYGEGIPMMLLEGAASGRPLVASDIPGCREVVEQGVNGLLVPPGDPARLAEALGQLAADRAARLEMGRRSRALAEARFGQETIIGSTLALYRELVP